MPLTMKFAEIRGRSPWTFEILNTHTQQNMHFTDFNFCVWCPISLNCDVISLCETDPCSLSCFMMPCLYGGMVGCSSWQVIIARWLRKCLRTTKRTKMLSHTRACPLWFINSNMSCSECYTKYIPRIVHMIFDLLQFLWFGIGHILLRVIYTIIWLENQPI